MPVKIQNGLPAARTLARENVFVMTEDRALTQDIRPLRILVLNLMPTKITTETQLLRVLGNTPLQAEVAFLRTGSYQSKNTDPKHLEAFYRTFDDVKDERWDGLIITGAPVEQMPFGQVNYWDELVRIFEWAKTNVFSTFCICWAAQAALYYYYGIEKEPVDSKVFGVFEHQTRDPKNKLMRGFDDVFFAPHSRHTTIDVADVEACRSVEVLADSQEVGLYLAASTDGRIVFATGHSEYDSDTLKLEYERDIAAGKTIEVPKNYFLDDDPSKPVIVRWRAHANLLYSNWLNYCVYQETPYDLAKLK
ncbi:MAG: homoserine O-succinyltransferase [Coriobacteriia bacterium]|nr:homoserine O-succinyltransferase [Coriobacteriia bacterium]MCL2871245.1 homoserine O-succinyltransferase [Coriobacteriia bacterium]